MNKSRTTSTRKLQIISEPHEDSFQLDMFNFVSDYALADVSLKTKQERMTLAKHHQAKTLPLTSYGTFDQTKTFLNFCMGTSNHLAVVAVKRFIQDDNSDFKMLYLRAESGVGKTHLLHAVANQLKGRHKIFFISSPLMMFSATESFSKLQSYSHILLDDLEEVEGNPELQKVFCQLMDYAQTGKIKIIFTSCKNPKDLNGCDERFKGKLSACLTHEIHPVDIDLAKEIIHSKCELLNINLPLVLRELIAQKFDYNVYGLEGALLKIKSKSEMTNLQSVTQSALEEYAIQTINLIPEDHSELFHLVADSFQITVNDLTSNVRRKNFALARHVCMFILKEKKGLNLKKISAIFGNDHTTVIYAVARIKREQNSDLKLRAIVQKIIQSL